MVQKDLRRRAEGAAGDSRAGSGEVRRIKGEKISRLWRAIAREGLLFYMLSINFNS